MFTPSDACELTFNVKTTQQYLYLSDDNRRVTLGRNMQSYSPSPERFDFRSQVLCSESLHERHYWEAEWTGRNVCIAVAYEGISRRGFPDYRFGNNDMSWCLVHGDNGYEVRHNNSCTTITFPYLYSDRVGVYLDWPNGILSFYSVSDKTLTHLYTFHTTFTEPLYPGFHVWKYDSSVSLCHVE